MSSPPARLPPRPSIASRDNAPLPTGAAPTHNTQYPSLPPPPRCASRHVLATGSVAAEAEYHEPGQRAAANGQCCARSQAVLLVSAAVSTATADG